MKLRGLILSPLVLALGCGSDPVAPDSGPSTFDVVVTAVNGDTHLPTADAPLPANLGDKVEAWDFTIQAMKADGTPDTTFDGYVRLSVKPGTVFGVLGDGANGRNIKLVGGKAAGTASVTAVYGPAHLWATDLGYVPAPPGKVPACSDGKDNNADGRVDFPADPGCAFADDDTEEPGTYSTGISAAIQYSLPKVSDIRGKGAAGTPYPYEAIDVATAAPQRVVVTRVASDGFYVTDIGAGEMWDPVAKTGGYNSVFAFNFSTPSGMRTCDILTYFSGTANDFFGFTELNFPSYTVSFPKAGEGKCEIPEPQELDGTTLADPVMMQRFQSQLVRISGFHIASNFGPGPIKNNVPGPGASSCDFNGDGQVDFASADEGTCSEVCDADPECSEWTAYSARGDVKVSKGGAIIKIQTGTVAGFDPVANSGQVLGVVTGTLRKFSGGSLNWTIEPRCADDLACILPGCGATSAVSSEKACVRLRTTDDPDEGTN